jgi:DNA polymerase III subunit gamma/tau
VADAPKSKNSGKPNSVLPPIIGDARLAEEPDALKATGYVVLARKYRPQTFEDLIGQAIMVRTLKNAFELDRIAQAYMLTGVRGVGKTTTARILARALNYERPGVPGKPTLDIAVPGAHCQAIMESRHIDVLEMDAASNTGIDDIREIIEAVRYKPAAARYRVFIIDEVHMLSKAAFNGLLKTLEEPPPHVKFIFATTEIRKVPVTILSRCQRFDLRRVDGETLEQHLSSILEKEGCSAEAGALALIARAAEGSVRDGLSLLDQALSLGRGQVSAASVTEMLGLPGRSGIFGLIEHIFAGETSAALSTFGALYDKGADPLMILTDAADAVHALSRLKALPEVYPPGLSAREKERARRLADKLPVPRLAIAWQMLLKGLDETSRAPRPIAAAEMLLIRMCYAAHLPSPADVIGGDAPIAQHHASKREGHRAPAGTAMEAVTPPGANISTTVEAHQNPSVRTKSFASFEDVVDHAGEIRDIKLKFALEEQSSLVKFGPRFIELHLLAGAPKNLAQELSKKMQSWTGELWIVSLSDARGLDPLGERRRQEEARAVEDVRKHPSVKSVMLHFPDAEIKAVRQID